MSKNVKGVKKAEETREYYAGQVFRLRVEYERAVYKYQLMKTIGLKTVEGVEETSVEDWMLSYLEPKELEAEEGEHDRLYYAKQVFRLRAEYERAVFLFQFLMTLGLNTVKELEVMTVKEWVDFYALAEEKELVYGGGLAPEGI